MIISEPSGFTWQRLRVAALIVMLIGLYVLARRSGLLEDADPNRIREIVMQWGVYGIVLYVALFSLGLFLYVPGSLFVIAAGLAYGKLWGIPVALLGANVAVGFSFFAVRFIGGTPFEQHSHPLIEKLLKSLHVSPVKNIAFLRLIMGTSPALNYLLALSAVRPRQHFLGSLIGMIVPVALVAYLADWLILGMF